MPPYITEKLNLYDDDDCLYITTFYTYFMTCFYLLCQDMFTKINHFVRYCWCLMRSQDSQIHRSDLSPPGQLVPFYPTFLSILLKENGPPDIRTTGSDGKQGRLRYRKTTRRWSVLKWTRFQHLGSLLQFHRRWLWKHNADVRKQAVVTTQQVSLPRCCVTANHLFAQWTLS